MRSNELRIRPLGDEEFPDEHRTIALRHVTKEQSENNLTRTFARAPEVLDAFLSWAINIMTRTTLPEREREIVTVRVAYLVKSNYELAQHILMSRDVGVTKDETERLERGVEGGGWSAADAALIRACDDLAADFRVSDAVWQSLLGSFSERQAMDVVMIAAQYFQLGMMLNSFGVQVDPSLKVKLAERGYP
jgi:4-carboxymuconolactone decarboxylase